MIEYAELELGLHRREAGSYAVEIRFSLPSSDVENRLAGSAAQAGQGQPASAQIDLEALNAIEYDPKAYGIKLTDSLFGDPQVKSAFLEALAAAGSQGYPIRLRLVVGPSAPELHSLHWETMYDLVDGNKPLFTGENLLFSRFLSSLDWRPVRLRPQGKLKALALIANPANLSEYDLAAVDVNGEVNRLRQVLGEIALTYLPVEGKTATLTNLLDLLRTIEVDILYIVAHGTIIRDQPWIFLEDDQGNVARVAGTDLAARIKELPQRPRLAVLASCQSASDRGAGTLAALGPRLAESGVPAVLAMQGNISIETLKKFMPVFFQELQRDGQIERALSVARGSVRDQADYWMPALFMRLKSGRIWYVPGFGEERQDFEKWPALIGAIKRNQCTPILGPGVFESLVGSQRELAQRWAEAYHYPLAPHDRESLPQVAQYLAVNQGRNFPYDELGEYLKGDILTRYSSQLPEAIRTKFTNQSESSLDELIEVVGAVRRQADSYDPYRFLAQLPLPIYITTNVHNLLTAALKEAGKDPQVMICPWNQYIMPPESIYDREPDYRPTPARPLVYHLFGRLGEPDSIVLTEDDYFDFLIGVTGNKDLIPSVIRRALADTGLLFLGFQVDDWNFRVLFRSIISQEGGRRRNRYAHIAAQIEPEEGRLSEPDRARRYLESYFNEADISLFWGSTDDFFKELSPRWGQQAS